MKDGPAYQYYAADFDEATAAWTNEEVGIYQRLLNYAWINEGLPDDPRRLAMIVRCGFKKFQKRWTNIEKKWTKKGNGFLVNNKMEEVRAKQRKYRAEQARKGKIGADIRWEEDSRGHSRGNGPRYGRKMALQSSSSSLKKKTSISLKGEEEKNCLFDYSDLAEKTDRICKTLSSYFPRENFYQWRQKQVNLNRHPDAIQEVLEILWKDKASIKDPKGPQGWLEHMMQVKSQNANERERIEESEKYKRGLVELANTLRGEK